MKTQTDTKDKIMDLAETFLLDRGYNGFSYKDISSALGIKNASIHYHFPKKTDLGVAIIRRAGRRFERWSTSLAKDRVPLRQRLDDFFLSFKRFVEQGQQVCLGGALETDFNTLPQEMREETCLFISMIHKWLEGLLTEGRDKGVFAFPGNPADQAFLIMSSLQGAIQIVRVTSPACYDGVTRQISGQICL